jgi:hypothetical protein
MPSVRAPQAKGGMQEHTAQLLRAIEGVGNRTDGLHERLDTAFERITKRRAVLGVQAVMTPYWPSHGIVG